MNQKKQRIVYIIGDYLTASLVWLLFNMLRYYEMAHEEGYTSLESFLLNTKVIMGQLFVPIFWLMLNALYSLHDWMLFY